VTVALGAQKYKYTYLHLLNRLVTIIWHKCECYNGVAYVSVLWYRCPFVLYFTFLLWAELEHTEEREYAAERNLAAFGETQTAGGTAECVELQDLEKPSGEFSRLMAEDDASEPAKPNYCRQVKALMRIRFLSERRMPFLWLMRIIVPVALVLIAALLWAAPDGLTNFSRFELKAGYYVGNNHSAVNPGLALVSSSAAGSCIINIIANWSCNTTVTGSCWICY